MLHKIIVNHAITVARQRPRTQTLDAIAHELVHFDTSDAFLSETLDHGFKYLRWIMCWDFDKSIKDGTEFSAVQELDARYLEISTNDDGKRVYFLNSRTQAVKIQVIRLKNISTTIFGWNFRLSDMGFSPIF